MCNFWCEYNLYKIILVNCMPVILVQVLNLAYSRVVLTKYDRNVFNLKKKLLKKSGHLAQSTISLPDTVPACLLPRSLRNLYTKEVHQKNNIMQFNFAICRFW